MKAKISFTSVVVVGLVVVFIILLSAIFPVAKGGKMSMTVDQRRINNNKMIIEECRGYYWRCTGGYVVWRDGRIFRIDDRGDDKLLTIGAENLVARMDMGVEVFLDRIDTVVLPDNHGWSETAVQYARKFVRVGKNVKAKTT